uniref:Uncharacterized protein n=1 Tax=Rhinopithecus roxellana TaxID=61622 RepID=A0A2K6P1M8_RHIRO
MSVELGWEVVFSAAACWMPANFMESADQKFTLNCPYKSLENIILTNDFVNIAGNWLLLSQQLLKPVWLQVLDK